MLAVTTLPWCVSTAAISMFPHHIVGPHQSSTRSVRRQERRESQPLTEPGALINPGCEESRGEAGKNNKDLWSG